MGRLIHTEAPGKVREQLRRTVAEMLRRLGQKTQLDDEAKDQASLIVFCLHGIADTVDQTVEAWEKRDYYLKAERFRREWAWLEPITDELSGVIHTGQWERLPETLSRLIPYFADVRITQMTRSSNMWDGAYEKLIKGDGSRL